MTWILVLSAFYGGHNVTIESVGSFGSKESCIKAGKKAVEELDQSVFTNFTFTCLERP